jgi:hypothetical protein
MITALLVWIALQPLLGIGLGKLIKANRSMAAYDNQSRKVLS